MSVIVGQAYEHLLKKKINQNADVGGWSFLQELSETKGIIRNREEDKTPYVHPVEKRSITKLSLEMCTESLGTENGSDSGDEILFLAFEATNIPKVPLTTKPKKETNFVSRENSFPPPLKGSYSRMVRSYKEDGRLVVQAIRVCSEPRCFVSERSEGRLRLCLSENSSISYDKEEDFEENDWEYESHDEEQDDAEEDLEGGTGNKKCRRPRRRCGENEHKTMLDWKQQQQFWVTT